MIAKSIENDDMNAEKIGLALAKFFDETARAFGLNPLSPWTRRVLRDRPDPEERVVVTFARSSSRPYQRAATRKLIGPRWPEAARHFGVLQIRHGTQARNHVTGMSRP